MGYAVSMEKRIAKSLAWRQCKLIKDENLVPSAVLVLLFQKDGVDHVLLTKRSDKVEYHKGEISFPGGRADPQDSDLLETALREAAEEIGLVPGDVKILGRLDDISTATTGFIVTPYVGLIGYPYPFRINANEIAELVFVPLQALAKACHIEAREAPWEEPKAAGCHFRYGDYIVWGATARILKQFLDITIPTTDPGRTGIGARGSTSMGSKGRKS